MGKKCLVWGLTPNRQGHMETGDGKEMTRQNKMNNSMNEERVS